MFVVGASYFSYSSLKFFYTVNSMTISLKHLVYRVALWDYLGENLDFDMDKIVIMQEEYLKNAILII